MALSTYGMLSEEIRNQYDKKIGSDNSTYTLRHIATMVAQEVAFFAKADAFEQSNIGEATFSNDQFIVTYNGLTMLTDVQGYKYVPLPSSPIGLPQGREVEYVGFTGNKKTQVFPMRNKDRFMQQMTKTPKWMALYYVENGNIIFDNLSPLISDTVDLKLVAGIPTGTNLLDLPLFLPRNYESIILDKVLNRMNVERNILPNNVNDNINR